jgi:hypothetical protein
MVKFMACQFLTKYIAIQKIIKFALEVYISIYMLNIMLKSSFVVEGIILERFI